MVRIMRAAAIIMTKPPSANMPHNASFVRRGSLTRAASDIGNEMIMISLMISKAVLNRNENRDSRILLLFSQATVWSIVRVFYEDGTWGMIEFCFVIRLD